MKTRIQSELLGDSFLDLPTLDFIDIPTHIGNQDGKVHAGNHGKEQDDHPHDSIAQHPRKRVDGGFSLEWCVYNLVSIGTEASLMVTHFRYIITYILMEAGDCLPPLFTDGKTLLRYELKVRDSWDAHSE